MALVLVDVAPTKERNKAKERVKQLKRERDKCDPSLARKRKK
jgi:hypothetical protein